MVVFGQSGCSWAKVFYFGQKWLYSSNVVVIGQNGCTSAKEVVFEERWICSCKVVVW